MQALGPVLDVSSGASAVAINFALRHFMLELKPGKVQPVASDSSSPAKVRAVLVRSCLLKPPPPPDPCSHSHRLLHPYPPCVHTHSLCSAFGNGETPQQDTAPHAQHKCAMNRKLCSAPEHPAWHWGISPPLCPPLMPLLHWEPRQALCQGVVTSGQMFAATVHS